MISWFLRKIITQLFTLGSFILAYRTFSDRLFSKYFFSIFYIYLYMFNKIEKTSV